MSTQATFVEKGTCPSGGLSGGRAHSQRLHSRFINRSLIARQTSWNGERRC